MVGLDQGGDEVVVAGVEGGVAKGEDGGDVVCRERGEEREEEEEGEEKEVHVVGLHGF